MNDGIYFEVFVVKDGVRYNQNIMNVTDVSNILTNSMLDGLGKILTVNENENEN